MANNMMQVNGAAVGLPPPAIDPLNPTVDEKRVALDHCVSLIIQRKAGIVVPVQDLVGSLEELSRVRLFLSSHEKRELYLTCVLSTNI